MLRISKLNIVTMLKVILTWVHQIKTPITASQLLLEKRGECS